MNTYVDDFYKLNCYPEILDALLPIQKLSKEISESMAIIKYLKRVTLKSCNKNRSIRVFDLCAGNALTSVIASFLYKNVKSYAIDNLPRKREWDKIRNFEYLEDDIYEYSPKYQFNDHINVIISVHPCRQLAERAIDVYNQSQADYLILMPCCSGKTQGWSLPTPIKQKIGNYLNWCMYLMDKIKGSKKLVIENKCISPKRAVLLGGF